ncbi:uncharacterized protein [Garra rufa]|uniref:uncharacterized protein n=1 Tax=Garra rufa TaxID=137080 RepID=UPI003CCE5F7E
MVYIFVLFCLCWWHLIVVFGESVSVTEGDSVTLHTDITKAHEAHDILWKFGSNSLIAKIKKQQQMFSTFDVPDGRFRDRLRLDNQTGFLTIINITTKHAGLYKLEITGVELSKEIFNVSVYARLPVPVIGSNSSQCLSSSSSSSSSQQNCSLVCSVVNLDRVTLSWYKGNSLLSSISVSDLSINLSLPLEVEYQDNNTYSCVLNNPISNQTQHLDISEFCHTCSAKIKKQQQIFSTFNVPDGRFRDRLRLDNHTGFLTIINITTEHAGLYKLEITGVELSKEIFNVSVYARLPAPAISSNSSQCLSSSSTQQNCSMVCSVVNVSHMTLSCLSLPLEVGYQDENTYSCVLNNSFTNRTQHLDISEFCHTCSGVFGESVSVTEGDSVTLNADFTETHEDDNIMWNFGTGNSSAHASHYQRFFTKSFFFVIIIIVVTA